MSNDASKPIPAPPAIPPELLGEVIKDVLAEFHFPAPPAAHLPVPPPVPAPAGEELLAVHPDYDEWVDMKKVDQENLQKILHPTDPLAHVPVIEVREGGSNDEGIAGDDWHEAVDEPTTHPLPSAEADAAAPEEK